MITSPRILAVAAILAALTTTLLAQSVSTGLRGPTPLDQEGPAAQMTPLKNTAEKEVRN